MLPPVCRLSATATNTVLGRSGRTSVSAPFAQARFDPDVEDAFEQGRAPWGPVDAADLDQQAPFYGEFASRDVEPSWVESHLEIASGRSPAEVVEMVDQRAGE